MRINRPMRKAFSDGLILTARIALAGVVAATVTAATARAQTSAGPTSSWSGAGETPAVKVQPKAMPAPAGRPKSPSPKPGTIDPTSNFRGTIGIPLGSNASMVPLGSGDEAAYQAFDQGQYLTALKLAEIQTRKGDAAAFTLIGRIYADGLGVPKDEFTAASWYSRGAELGDTEAAFLFGVLLAQGGAIEKNLDQAGQMFEKAALKEHPQANYNLALLFLSGNGKPENPNRAALHMQYAAQKGVAAAQYDLATLYQKGHGVQPDAYEAARWMRRAAEQGMADAEYDYAVMLLKGFGLNADVPRTVDYLKSAANKGVAGAQNRLAHVILEGVLVLPNGIEAAKWRVLAKSSGLTDAALDDYLAKMPKPDRAAADAAAQLWRDKAALDIAQ
jgi:uncharacterized protein